MTPTATPGVVSFTTSNRIIPSTRGREAPSATRTAISRVRVALGASRPRVLGMILFDVVKLTAPGVAVGLILTAAFIRLNPMGIPLSNVETLAYVLAAAIAILVAVLASLAPARRAAAVLPMVAMRSE